MVIKNSVRPDSRPSKYLNDGPYPTAFGFYAFMEQAHPRTVIVLDPIPETFQGNTSVTVLVHEPLADYHQQFRLLDLTIDELDAWRDASDLPLVPMPSFYDQPLHMGEILDALTTFRTKLHQARQFAKETT